MKKRILMMLLAIVMMAGLASAMTLTASAAEGDTIYVGGVKLNSSNDWTTTGENGGTATYDPVTYTLTLDNYTYSGEGNDIAAIYYSGSEPLKLVLKNQSSVTHAGNALAQSYGIYSYSGLIVSDDSTGSLTAAGGESETHSYGVYASGSISVSGGSLTGTSGKTANSYGVTVDRGDISVSGTGSLTGTGDKAGSNSVGVIINNGSISVSGGSLTGTGSESERFSIGVSANNGVVSVSGGSLTAASDTADQFSHGLESNKLTVSGGEIVAEGVNGACVNITGTITINNDNLVKWDSLTKFYIVNPVKAVTVVYPDLLEALASKDVNALVEFEAVAEAFSKLTADQLEALEEALEESTVSVEKLCSDWTKTNVILKADNLYQAYLEDPTEEAEQAYNSYYASITDDLKDLVDWFIFGIVDDSDSGSNEGGVNAGQDSIVVSGYDNNMRYWMLMMMYNQEFDITATASDGGTITPAGVSKVKYSKDMLYTITPDDGYMIADVIIDGESIGAVEAYSFDNVRKAHTISVIFTEIPWQNPYSDVSESDWFYEDVQFVTENNLMIGTDENETFAPDLTAARAMIVTILWRMEGEPLTDSAVDFFDVPADEWYSEAVKWASANGIVQGCDDQFNPNNPITREQLAAMLHRCAAYKGMDDGIALPMIPQCECSVWAENDVNWADANGLLDGIGNDMSDMTEDATRAEAAAMLRRLCENFGE